MTEDLLYFEDLEPEMAWDCGSVTVEKSEMVEFAEQYDPQPQYVDEEAAKDSIFGELIASGFFTVGIAMRLVVTEVLSILASETLHGMENLNWHNPVYPGDALSVTVEILETHLSDTWPNKGHLKSAVRMTNQHDQPILTMVGKALIEQRPEADE